MRFHTAIMELHVYNIMFLFLFLCVYICSEGRMATQAAKLKCVLCYFQRVAEDRCNLSSVITLRRQVQLLSLPPSLSLCLLSYKSILALDKYPIKFASYKMLALVDLSSFLLPVRLVS